ncbi:hypothetical protein CgunFtcFv8_009840 [Champsocephalus gunnari]|uniref:Uncharacterized protein n=1 Tax=Champsocephalus gunnari TaxID=52237 RepID=A0AAN8C3Q9_CHAGU|nr:hypothetical protein CgunFtcFv8_009840 [Champsocephalus gunnari]
MKILVIGLKRPDVFLSLNLRQRASPYGRLRFTLWVRLSSRERRGGEGATEHSSTARREYSSFQTFFTLGIKLTFFN